MSDLIDIKDFLKFTAKTLKTAVAMAFGDKINFGFFLFEKDRPEVGCFISDGEQKSVLTFIKEFSGQLTDDPEKAEKFYKRFISDPETKNLQH